MADLFSVISGIEPSPEEVLSAELFARQYLQAKFPDLDLRYGTGISDTTIRPAAFLLAICQKAINYVFSNYTLDGVTNDTDPAIVDKLMSNLFLDRRTGNYSIISARLYFARRKIITLYPSTSFSTDGSKIFFPSTQITFPESALTYDSFSDEWYVDTQLVASQKGSEFNISEGSLLYFSNFDPYFLRGEINHLVTASQDAETNTEFVTRAATAVSTRNLINEPSIISRILADLNYVKKCVVVGDGDPLMHRDQVMSKGVTYSTIPCTGAFYSPSVGESSTLPYGYVIALTIPTTSFGVGQRCVITEVLGVPPGSSPLMDIPATVVRIDSTSSLLVKLDWMISPRSLGSLSVLPKGEDFSVRAGGCVDVYTETDLTLTSSQLEVDSSGKVEILGPILLPTRINGEDDTSTSTNFSYSFEGVIHRADLSCQFGMEGVICRMKGHCLSVGRLVNLQNFPATGYSVFLRVAQVIDGDVVSLAWNSAPTGVAVTGLPVLYFTSCSNDTWGSIYQKTIIQFNSGVTTGDKVTFQYYKYLYLDSLQEYLDHRTNKVVCANYQVRGSSTTFLDFSLSSSNSYSTEEVSSAIESYLDSLEFGETFVMANLISHLSVKGITDIKLPVTFSKLYTGIDGLPMTQTGLTSGVITPDEPIHRFRLRNVSVTLTTLSE